MNRVLVRAFALTLFVSAFLLFWCQPMVGKMVLPLLGGASSVWTTCVLFFQAALLIGYVYAHWLSSLHNVRLQIAIHGVVLLLPIVFLPIGFSGGMGERSFSYPVLTLLLNLVTTVGVPFFAISTTAPLLQSWFSRTGHASAKDPYFLYAASNAGSLLGLLAYPLVVEPRIGAAAQSRAWTAGYALLLLMIAIVSGLIWRTALTPSPVGASEGDESAAKPNHRMRGRWVLWAFLASGVMLAVTNRITSDLAAAPFLWILPLAIYLVTFIVAFSGKLNVTPDRVSRLLPVALLAVFPAICADISPPPGLNWALIALHLVLLYPLALLCHARLAQTRPPSRYLTEFYFWIALGGVLGGVFTATVAPLVFSTVLEYPLLVAAIAFVRLPGERGYQPTDNDWNYPALVAVAVTIVWLVFRKTDLDSTAEAKAIAHTAFVFIAYRFKNRPIRFGLTLAILMIAYSIAMPQYIEGAERVFVTRDFFAVKKVIQNVSYRLLLNGTITHGMESRLEPGQPVSYYFPTGTMGDVMFHSERPFNRVAVVGLGTGTMSAFATEGRHITFFDIDPQVESIARDYFTFLPKCGASCDVVIGDGRLELQRMPDASFDLLMLDAFSSDAIPAHLMSREAVQLYMRKLAPDGVILFHVSNRYLRVQLVAEALAMDAGLVAFQRFDAAGDLVSEGKSDTNFVIAARNLEALGAIPTMPGWRHVTEAPAVRVWTDDYSSLLEIIRWH